MFEFLKSNSDKYLNSSLPGHDTKVVNEFWQLNKIQIWDKFIVIIF